MPDGNGEISPLQCVQHYAHSLTASQRNSRCWLSHMEGAWPLCLERREGILILAPIFRKQTAEKFGQADQPNKLVGFRAVYVFDLADTDGQPLPTLAETEGDPAGYTNRLKQFITQRGIQLEYSSEIYPALGLCSPGKIVLFSGAIACGRVIDWPSGAAVCRLHPALFPQRRDAAESLERAACLL
jgi:hypothetical protein